LPFGAAEKATGLWHTGNRIVHPFLRRERNRVNQGVSRASYTDSKLALLLFTQELNRVFHQSQAPIRAVAVNPGAVYSDIWRLLPYPLRHYIVEPVLRRIFLTTRQGAAAVLAAARHMPLGPDEEPELLAGKCYVTPYWIPFDGKIGSWSLYPCDVLGPFVGSGIRVCFRLPQNPQGKARKLWESASLLVDDILEKEGLLSKELGREWANGRALFDKEQVQVQGEGGAKEKTQ